MGLVALWHVDLPRSGIEPLSPALAGRFFTTEPLRKPSLSFLLLLMGTQLPVQGLSRVEDPGAGAGMHLERWSLTWELHFGVYVVAGLVF